MEKLGLVGITLVKTCAELSRTWVKQLMKQENTALPCLYRKLKGEATSKKQWQPWIFQIDCLEFLIELTQLYSHQGLRQKQSPFYHVSWGRGRG